MKSLDKYILDKDKKHTGFKNSVENLFKELEIAYLLREARESNKITQLELAKKCNLSQQAISKIENAKDDHISLHTLNKYANALGYKLDLDIVSL